LLLIQAAKKQVHLVVQFFVWMISRLLADWTFTLMDGLFRHHIPLYCNMRVLYHNTKLFLNHYLVAKADIEEGHPVTLFSQVTLSN
jgi:hypothetical protein